MENKAYTIRETDLMDILIEEEDKLFHKPIRSYWIEISTPFNYKNAQEFVKHLQL